MGDRSRKRSQTQLAPTVLAIAATLVVIALAAAIMYVLLPVTTTVSSGGPAGQSVSAPRVSTDFAASSPSPANPIDFVPQTTATAPPTVTAAKMEIDSSPSATSQATRGVARTPTASVLLTPIAQSVSTWTPQPSFGVPPSYSPIQTEAAVPTPSKTSGPVPTVIKTAILSATSSPTSTTAPSPSPTQIPTSKPTIEPSATDTPELTIAPTDPPAPSTGTANPPAPTEAPESDNLIAAPKIVASPLGN